jgi:hypothetical protein
MSRRYTRTTVTSAAPSESGWGAYRGERVCAGCREHVTVTRTLGGLWFERDERVWHMACRLGTLGVGRVL